MFSQRRRKNLYLDKEVDKGEFGCDRPPIDCVIAPPRRKLVGDCYSLLIPLNLAFPCSTLILTSNAMPDPILVQGDLFYSLLPL